MDIHVFPDNRLVFDGRTYRCALGRGGVRVDKREGDGATPAGRFALRRLHIRADKVAPPRTALPLRIIAPDDGWCDDPSHVSYNRLVRLPFQGSCENMWRDDDLYDLVIELGHNDSPPLPGAGSAVFMHVAKHDYATTEGCVALAKSDLLTVLESCSEDTCIDIAAEV